MLHCLLGFTPNLTVGGGCRHDSGNLSLSRIIKREKSVKPSVALAVNRSAVRAATQRFPTTNPRIFGSVLYGTDQDGSDLDLLVDALPGATLFDLGGLQIELEELLGVPVDLLTPGDLPARIRNQVLGEARPL